jgi:hypothetical protein
VLRNTHGCYTCANQITGISPVNSVSRCSPMSTVRGRVMHLQFDACVIMTYKLVSSVILTFGFYANHEMR